MENSSQKELRKIIIKQLPALGLTLIIAAGFYLLFFKFFSAIQASHMPADTILSNYVRIGSLFMFVPILYPSFFIGIIIRQFFEWFIPAKKKEWEKSFEKHKTTFKKNMRSQLLHIAISLLITIPLALLGTKNYFYITKKGIHYSTVFSLSEKLYYWHDIKNIQEREIEDQDGNSEKEYNVIMYDNCTINLMEHLPKFRKAYPYFKKYISRQTNIQYIP